MAHLIPAIGLIVILLLFPCAVAWGVRILGKHSLEGGVKDGKRESGVSSLSW